MAETEHGGVWPGRQPSSPYGRRAQPVHSGSKPRVRVERSFHPPDPTALSPSSMPHQAACRQVGLALYEKEGISSGQPLTCVSSLWRPRT
eukprot:3379907-Pleurochrysis_carterae.AAC.1